VFTLPDGSFVATYYSLLGTTVSQSPLFLFQAFSRGFSKNMKLEAVNPVNPGEVCVATVVSVKGRLLWLHLEGMCNQLLFRRTWGYSLEGGVEKNSALS
jgi:hypothetical protein